MSDQPSGERSPLLEPDWRYIEKDQMEDFRAADWSVLNAQRGPYYARQQARQVLRLLTCSRDDPGFGYQINNYRHCLQTATMVMRAGHDEETIVVALLHDIGFVTCPTTHGEFAAAMLGPYISEQNHWMLVHHGLFQNFHCHEYPGMDRLARERWREHPHFEWTAQFVAEYDQNAIQPRYGAAPIEVFEPLVERIFAREPKNIERSR